MNTKILFFIVYAPFGIYAAQEVQKNTITLATAVDTKKIPLFDTIIPGIPQAHNLILDYLDTWQEHKTISLEKIQDIIYNKTWDSQKIGKIAIAPDNSFFVAEQIAGLNFLTIYDLHGSVKQNLRNYHIHSLAISPDGNYIAIGSDQIILLKRIEGVFKEIAKINFCRININKYEFPNTLTSLIFSSDSQSLIAGTFWGAVCIYQVINNHIKLVHAFSVFPDKIDTFAMTTESFSTQDTDYCNIQTKNPDFFYSAPDQWEETNKITSIALSADNTYLALVINNKILIYDAKNYSLYAEYAHDQANITAIAFSNDNKTCIASCLDHVKIACTLPTKKWEAFGFETHTQSDTTSDQDLEPVSPEPELEPELELELEAEPEIPDQVAPQSITISLPRPAFVSLDKSTKSPLQDRITLEIGADSYTTGPFKHADYSYCFSPDNVYMIVTGNNKLCILKNLARGLLKSSK
jgi:WD40 repeat protein